MALYHLLHNLVHIMSLTCKAGDCISWRNVKTRDLYAIIGTNDMVALASMVVEFVLTLLLLLNILVSLMHTCSILIKDLVVNPLEKIRGSGNSDFHSTKQSN